MDYAITITAKETAELLPLERPKSPVGPDEVSGKTLVTLISAGTELASAYLGTNFPSTPGYAAVFQVEEVGQNVKEVRSGDLAFCMGNHRSYYRVRADQLLLVPEGLSPEIAVFARMMGVSMTTLTTTTARPPAKVLVMGLGLVGHLATKNFLACGYNVYACDPVESRRRIATETGIPNVLPAAPLDDPDLSGRFSLVIECSGHEQALLDGCNAIRKKGEVVCIATPWKRHTELYAHELHHAIFHKYVVIRSGWEWELPMISTDFTENSVWGNIQGALNWLSTDRVNVEGIYNLFSPDQAQEAYQKLLHKQTDRLAAVFDWRDI